MNRCWRHDIHYEGNKCPRCAEDERYTEQRTRQQRQEEQNRERERRQERERAEAEQLARERDRKEEWHRDKILREQQAVRAAAQEAASIQRERFEHEKARWEQEQAHRELRAGLPEFPEAFRQEWARLNEVIKALAQRNEKTLRELNESQAVSALQQIAQIDLEVAAAEKERSNLAAAREKMEHRHKKRPGEQTTSFLRAEFVARTEKRLPTRGQWFAENGNEGTAWDCLVQAYRVFIKDPVLDVMLRARKMKEAWPSKLASFIEMEEILPVRIDTSNMPRVGAPWSWGANRRRAVLAIDGLAEAAFKMAKVLNPASVRAGASASESGIDWASFAEIYALRVAAHPDRYFRTDISKMLDQERAEERKRLDSKAASHETEGEKLTYRRAEVQSAYNDIQRKHEAQAATMMGEIRKVGAQILQGLRLPNAHGEIQRCPACAGPLATGSTSCIYCGATFGPAG